MSNLSNYETALAYLEMGISTIPVSSGTKVPEVPWKEFQERLPTPEEIRDWYSPGVRKNIAIICGNAEVDLVGFDIDDPAKKKRVLENCGPTPVMTRTPRGGEHWIYQADGTGNNSTGEGIDVRFGKSGLLLVPDSELPNGKYEHVGRPLYEVGLDNLPTASVAWLQKTARHEVRRNIEVSDPSFMFRRARAWLSCVEGAVAGSRGHDKTFRVACRLTHYPPKGFGLDFEEAMILLEMFNEVCEPKWTRGELEHKAIDAIAKR